MLDDVGRAQPSARGAYAKVTSHFFAPRPPTSVLGILYVGIANPRAVAVCRRVGGRRSDIVAPCLGKREVVSSLLRKEIILSVNQHPGKLTADFCGTPGGHARGEGQRQKKRETQKTLTPVIARRKVNTMMT